MNRTRIQDVPIPIWMQKLPKDKRGYPIPVLVQRDTDGRPHFTINDESVRQRVLKEDRCGICDRKLLRRRASVGGPSAAFHPFGAYIDPPMHPECARYALQVCPYLAVPSWTKRIEGRTLDPSKLPEGVIGVTDPTMDPNQPELFVLVLHDGQNYVVNEFGFKQYVKPKKPYVAVEYWRGGERLPDNIGEAAVKEILAKVFEKERLEFEGTENVG